MPFYMLGSESIYKTTHKPNNDSIYVLNAFNKADGYMETDDYDNAQLWLNKIYQKVSYRKPSLFSYYLTTRQAEIYYYNNLHQLGMQEAFNGEYIATILKDKLLIADACNFIGLFYMNNNKLPQAIKYYKKALRYTSQPPYKNHYIELSKPHHIYGNLAEAFEKAMQPDSAIFYALISVEKAKEINSGRGMATTTLNLGSAYFSKKNIDSAFKYYNLSLRFSAVSRDFDVQLCSYSGLADCASAKSNKVLAFNNLGRGFALIKEHPHLNDLYLSMFLEIAVKIYRNYNQEALLLKAVEMKTQMQTALYKRNTTQVQTLLLTGIANEKTIFNLELADAQGKQALANTRLYILLLLFLLMAIAFITYRYYSMQRLKVADLRSKISQDLHDEVGATLSGIAMYSYITKEQVLNKQNELANNSLDIIKDNAGEMVGKLNDIVWAVNPAMDNAYTLAERLKEFAFQHTAAKNIKLVFVANDALAVQKFSMEKRKNIYLICKEAINNAVKYSECTQLSIQISVLQKHVYIVIADNGKGFSHYTAGKGNGLTNMAARAAEITAKLEVNSRESNGVTISLTCKIT